MQMTEIQSYLLLDFNDILEGVMTHHEPKNDNDLLIKKVGGEFYHIIRDGARIVKTLNKLVSEYNFKILHHASSNEADQLKSIETLKSTCSLKGIEFPQIFAMAVCDEKKHKGAEPADPIIIKDRPHGIWIAAYAKGKSGKSSARTALSKLLGISDQSKKSSYVLDNELLVVLKAKSEGWSAIQIGGDDSTLSEAVQKIYRTLSFGPLPLLKPEVNNEEESKSPMKDFDSSFVGSKSNAITRQSPVWETEIVFRAEEQFDNTGRPRIGGSAWSSGVFKEYSTGKLWLGKSDSFVLNVSEALACKEKVAIDFYSYFGVRTPRVELSLQRGTNTGLAEYEKDVSVHIMSELIPDLKTIGSAHDQLLNPFRANFPNPNREITVKIEDGTKRNVPERGLGHILAVARLINDIDVIGASGGNVGYLIEKDIEGKEYARSLKIDPGEAFSQLEDEKMSEKRTIRVAAGGYAHNTILDFDKLPKGTQEEFLMTLHRIAGTDRDTFRKLLDRKGANSYIRFMKLTTEKLLAQILERKSEMIAEYEKDLEKSRPLYELQKGKDLSS